MLLCSLLSCAEKAVQLYTSLAVVDGNPAISYHKDVSESLMYIRASDAIGSAWDMPQAIDSPIVGEAGAYSSLAVINGNPAISYYFSDLPDTSLRFIRYW